MLTKQFSTFQNLSFAGKKSLMKHKLLAKKTNLFVTWVYLNKLPIDYIKFIDFFRSIQLIYDKY